MTVLAGYWHLRTDKSCLVRTLLTVRHESSPQNRVTEKEWASLRKQEKWNGQLFRNNFFASPDDYDFFKLTHLPKIQSGLGLSDVGSSLGTRMRVSGLQAKRLI